MHWCYLLCGWVLLIIRLLCHSLVFLLHVHQRWAFVPSYQWGHLIKSVRLSPGVCSKSILPISVIAVQLYLSFPINFLINDFLLWEYCLSSLGSCLWVSTYSISTACWNIFWMNIHWLPRVGMCLLSELGKIWEYNTKRSWACWAGNSRRYGNICRIYEIIFSTMYKGYLFIMFHSHKKWKPSLFISISLWDDWTYLPRELELTPRQS